MPIEALFPIGELEKPEVRKIAKEQGLVTADKKDSQGLCFIGKVSLPDFLQQQLKPKSGEIIEISNENEIYSTPKPEFNSKFEELKFESEGISYEKSFGEIVGKHDGAHYFTKGQRKGLGVGGKIEPLFVLDTDVEENIIYTGQGKNHPGLYKKALFIAENEIHWVREDLKLNPNETMQGMVRIRYRQPLQKATLHKAEKGLYIEFEKPQSAITEGQFAAWYSDDELIGSGVIN
jgi:tRNA-specific 2-thiouridylase